MADLGVLKCAYAISQVIQDGGHFWLVRACVFRMVGIPFNDAVNVLPYFSASPAVFCTLGLLAYAYATGPFIALTVHKLAT